MKNIMTLSLICCLFLACSKQATKEETTTDEVVVTNVDIIKNVYLSLEQGKIDAFIALMDEQIEWNEAENYIYDDNPYIGPQAVMDGIMGRIAADWDSFSVDERLFYAMENDMVLVTGRYTGTHKVTGKSINAQVAHHWTLKNGKIIRFQQYTDTKQVAEAIIE